MFASLIGNDLVRSNGARKNLCEGPHKYPSPVMLLKSPDFQDSQVG